ncbi:MFS transporter [Tepidibacillus decaturensis]|uniref:Major facilitator superfamily (MFS) profile domain-containing protein n=1 Tax=Tepidibacillus decaturensis TaxID=1413211 RepID=A0A135L3I6_9BACI|nr:MFS transporter [Tepidibacillus decaturensis]KXG43594.1 hypothetical protein U473_05875 [Tepidibacillus decaturensis]
MHYPYEIVQKNKHYSILNGAYSTIANTYTGFISLYAINILHANNQQVGLINSLPAIVSLITTVIGGYWFSRQEMKRKVCGIGILSTRFFLLLFALIPFLPLYQAWVLVILIGLMNVPGSLTNLSWQSLIGDLIPEKERGLFFSNRNRILTIVGMVSTALVGWILNHFNTTNPYPFQILFFVSFLFGLLEAYYLFKHVERKEYSLIDSTKSNHLLTAMKESISEKPFLFFLLSSMLFNFGWQMAWPLFSIYQIKTAGATAVWLSLFTVTNQLSQILTYTWWGRMSERFGNSVMLFIASAGMASAPFLTVLSTNLVYLTMTNLFTGAFLAGTNFLLFNQLLGVSPGKNRSSYITLYTIVIGFIGFISPQIGVWLLSLTGMFWAMNISSVIRLLGAFAFFVVAFKFEKDRIPAILRH